MLTTLFSSPIFALFIIIAIGFIVGRIEIKGINLDVSAVIFVALLFGHYGVMIPDDLGNFGMALFIFSIGIQAGPGFFGTFKSKGKTLSMVAAVLVVSAAGVTLALRYIFGFTAAEATGLLTGSLTSTPGLATARELSGDNAAISYGIAYPFGVIGVILFVKLLPRILGIDVAAQARELESQESIKYPAIESSAFRVTNGLVVGRTLEQLGLRTMTGAIISRIVRGGKSIIPTGSDTIEMGDLFKAVGTADSLDKMENLVGHKIEGDLPFGDDIELQTALVTTKSLVGRDLGSLNLQQNFSTTITRVRRSGLSLAPDPKLKIKFGDKLTMVGPKENMSEVMSLLGNQSQKLSDTDFFPIALGIVIGVIVGHISISFSDSFSFSFGLTGGILLSSLVLSSIGKTGPVIWTISSSSNQLLRQMGLLLFLANVGTSAGANLVSTFLSQGWTLFVSGILITLLPMIIATFVAIKVFKINVLELLGTLTGGMTSTPGLAAADSMSSSSATSIAYATVYPVAMVLLIICTQIIAMIN